jgi:hypothetical protein
VALRAPGAAVFLCRFGARMEFLSLSGNRAGMQRLVRDTCWLTGGLFDTAFITEREYRHGLRAISSRKKRPPPFRGFWVVKLGLQRG